MDDGVGCGVFLGCVTMSLFLLLIFIVPRPFTVEEIRLNYDDTDIVIVASSTGSNMEIETSNLALADRKEYVKRLSALIDEIKKANSGDSNDR